jgi:hypothetical protein
MCQDKQPFAEGTHAVEEVLVEGEVLGANVEVQKPRISRRVLRGRPVVVSNKRKAGSYT